MSHFKSFFLSAGICLATATALQASEADLASAEVRPMIDKFVRGRAGVSAEERIALFS